MGKEVNSLSRKQTLVSCIVLTIMMLCSCSALAGEIYLLTATGTVDNSMYRYISRGIAAAEAAGAAALLVEVDTFGGLCY